MSSIWVVYSLDSIGNFILQNSSDFIWFTSNHIENWAYGFQMSSFCTQLFWVFNQAIPAWIITLLFLCQQNNRSIIFIYSFSLLTCSLPAIGMIPIIACIFIQHIIKLYDKKINLKYNIKHILKEILTFQNIFTGITVITLSGMFLNSNKTSGNTFRMTDMKKFFMPYLIFIFLEFLIYYISIYKIQRKTSLYWTTLITLLIIPIISFGPHIDFVMRASIPSLIVLFIMTADSLTNYLKKKQIFYAVMLTSLLLFGGITPYHEIVRSISITIEHEKNPDIQIIPNKTDLFEDGYRNNFFGEYGDSIFFKYLSKQ